jgi:hypothetical protein
MRKGVKTIDSQTYCESICWNGYDKHMRDIAILYVVLEKIKFIRGENTNSNQNLCFCIYAIIVKEGSY